MLSHKSKQQKAQLEAFNYDAENTCHVILKQLSDLIAMMKFDRFLDLPYSLGHLLKSSGSQTFFAMEPLDIIGNITELLFKLILNTIKEMLHLTKLMTRRPFLSGDRPPFDMQSRNTVAKLAAMFGIHYRICYECSFAEPLIFLRGTHFENLCSRDCDNEKTSY